MIGRGVNLPDPFPRGARKGLSCGIVTSLLLVTMVLSAHSDELDRLMDQFRQQRFQPRRQRQAALNRMRTDIARFEKERVRDALIQLCGEETDALMRVALVRVVGRFEGKEVREFLGRELLSRSERVQVAAASQIGRHLDTRSLHKVMQLFRRGHLTSAVRGALEASLGRIDDSQLFEELLSEVKKIRKSSGMASSARILGALGRAAAIPLLVKMARHRDPEVQYHALESLRRFDEPSLRKVFEKATESRKVDVAFCAILGLGRFAVNHAGASRRILGFLQGGSAWFQMAAADAVGRNGLIEGFGPLVERLESQDWRVRSAAIENLARLRMKGSIGPLIGRMEKENGRLRHDAIEALESLTGQSFGDSIANWKSWWQRNGSDFLVSSRVPVKRRGSGDGESELGYFGIPIHSKNIVFVLDVSNSMLAAYGEDRTVPAGPAGGRRRPGSGGTSRLDVARNNLVEVIRGFDSDARFNIVLFHAQIFLWQNKLTPATESNKKRAEFFVFDQKMGLQTLIYDSVEKAMRMPGVDTVILLTDGAPTMGRFTDPAEMVREILRLDRTLRIRFHTIDLGGQQTWMARLAGETGGQTVNRK